MDALVHFLWLSMDLAKVHAILLYSNLSYDVYSLLSDDAHTLKLQFFASNGEGWQQVSTYAIMNEQLNTPPKQY